MSCQICYSRMTKRHRKVPLTCDCKVCSRCFSDWLREQLKSYAFAQFQVTCPTPQHANVLSRDQLKTFVSKRDLEAYDKACTKRTVLDSSYKRCPGCNAVGWTESSFCLMSYECRNCGRCWRDSKEINALTAIPKAADQWSDNFFVWVKKEMTTEQCPKCDSSIEKNGGCNHMTCSWCHHEFCWICKGPYHAHDYSFCGNYTALVSSWTFLICGLAGIKLGSTLFPMLSFIVLRYFGCVVFAAILCFLLVILCCGHVSLILNLSRRTALLVLPLLLFDVGMVYCLLYLWPYLASELSSLLGILVTTLATCVFPLFPVYRYLNN